MGDSLNLPPELLCQIALHLPLTTDVLTFGLIHSRVRQALSTPALFKARLAFQGWDVSAWKDQDDCTALERWTRIDHIYCRTAQLFEEAAADSSCLSILAGPVAEVGAGDVIWGLAQSCLGLYINSRNQGRSVLNASQMANWLRKLSCVLPAFITHHRGDNISRITEPRHRFALWSYRRFVHCMCRNVERPRLLPMPSEYGWLERACFSFIALIMQCDASTITSIFQATSLDLYYLLSNLHAFCLESVASSAPSQQRASELYFSGFLVQSNLSLLLLFDAAGEPQTLPPPSLPYIDPPSCYDEPFDLGTTSPMRPWLRNGLAGTALAGLSSSEIGRPWAGYHIWGFTRHGPPMFLELCSARPPEDPVPDCLYFRGEGHDVIGHFSLGGNCDTQTRVVTTRKIYMEDYSEWWTGMITPFGMVGACTPQMSRSWWWIWPREWSAATTDLNRTS